MLADIYGSQRLLATGAIPHQLVFSDPSYLRPCQHLKPAGGYIQFFAADLARGPDGRWRVIDTHTETPAGIGYALANRMVHTNVAGDIFSACNALRLAPFFQQMQSALARRANRADPSIALLTPGPRHNDFFSHAYLARYLGLLLVEGGDLRVVGDRVSLKTLDGLMPIDLIVRCIAGAVADPLELDSSGFAGPVGLLQAVREQPDLVVNALGSALAENRGLSAYLPELARRPAGRGPRHRRRAALVARRSDGAPACARQPRPHGDPAGAREHGPAGARRAGPRSGAAGADRARGAAAGDRAQGADAGRRGEGRLRHHAVADAGRPGAQALRRAPVRDRHRQRLRRHARRARHDGRSEARRVALSAPDGESRDVWVISDATLPPHAACGGRPSRRRRCSAAPHDLPSRAADNLFWLGRYIERADWTMRVLRTCLSRLQEDSGPRQELRASRTALEILLAKDEGEVPATWETTDAALIERLARNLMTSSDWYYGLPRTLDNIHRVASLTRDRLSLEAWRTLNDFYAGRRWRADAMPTVDRRLARACSTTACACWRPSTASRTRT